MTMAVLSIRSEEEKNWVGRTWIVLSCVSVFAMMGTGYALQSQPIGEYTAGKEEMLGSQQQNNQPHTLELEHNSKSSEAVGRGVTSSPNVGSYGYLVEILEALKKGEPIPRQYLELLPESDRFKYKQPAE
ncbi:hypothetical protein ACFO8Q_12100 [Effusibacillus consociatus]|uniref:Uncharacterized protein n=2 Tax=Effusibacillus consociatus TaxID=1117041 RepID=A0ABV9Q4B6_9BACL